MNTTSAALLYLSCCAAFVDGRLKSKLGFPPLGTGAVLNGMGRFAVISGLDPFQEPPYLRDVTDEARDEYFAILKRANRTIAEHKDEVLRWARKYLLEEKLAEFDKKEEKSKKRVRTGMHDLLEEIRGVYEKFNEVVDNEEQTHQERRQALLELKKEYSEAFAVIKFAIGLLSTRRRRHPGEKPRPGVEFYRRHQGNLIQRRLKGGKKLKKIERPENFEEISNGTMIMRGTDHHHERFWKDGVGLQRSLE
ncbi:hypothetical protein Y032_0788g2356 [Ancylostoma ceylanicum]|uniref:SXP/RAL-2 family protein Ani s 5-like cation-binding domain-containing protein n=1 Tax=Ancylostoma ceylanicum TaxID=53326 RepID=A0A016WCW1_9BILA|nr:hypothetical protein Y032_0788g2356 [Ancylostoma ceylanicum]